MTNQLTTRDELTEFLLYTTPNGKVKVEIFFHDENIWLTQKRMAELFGVNVPAVSKHLKNIFSTGELDENSVVSILETTAEDGKSYKTKYYNLDVIISVGYRVNSTQATSFTMPFPVKPRRKSSMTALMPTRNSWGLRPGKTVLKAGC